MIKRKNTSTPKNDIKVAAIVLGFVCGGIVLFLILSKGKEARESLTCSKSPPGRRDGGYVPVPMNT